MPRDKAFQYIHCHWSGNPFYIAATPARDSSAYNLRPCVMLRRYAYDDAPLNASTTTEAVPGCAACRGPRVFELQLLPYLMSCLKPLDTKARYAHATLCSLCSLCSLYWVRRAGCAYAWFENVGIFGVGAYACMVCAHALHMISSDSQRGTAQQQQKTMIIRRLNDNTVFMRGRMHRSHAARDVQWAQNTSNIVLMTMTCSVREQV